MKLFDRLLKEIETIPDVHAETSPVPGGYCIRCRGKEFGHFHNDSEIDLRLSKKLIKDFGLEHPTDSTFHPNRSNNSAWIELRFSNTREMKQVIKFVELATTLIK